MIGSARVLTERERTTLAAVCDAFLPRLEPAVGDSEALFRLSAADVGVAAAFEQAMLALSKRQNGELRLFLRLLDSRLFMLLFAHRASRFANQSSVDRETALLTLRDSRVPQIRSGYQALKRLATFLYYSVTNDQGLNPTWPTMEYEPLRPAPATSRLRITRVSAPAAFDADVCVIGSGAGGGVVAERLASAGRTVVVLEAGPGDQAAEFDQREIVGMQRLYLDQGTTSSRDLGVAILAGSSVGGGTTVNWQTSLRLPDVVRQEWSDRSGIRAFVDDAFTRAFDAVCERSCVGTAESARNANNTQLERGCAALGYRWTHIARNSRGCDLSQCGFCVFGCRVGGKHSTANTYLVDAQRDGRTAIVASCRARRLIFDRGDVAGVDAVASNEDGNSFPVRVSARTVVVAAGGVETPAFLLRSGLTHRQLGRNLYLHPTSAVAGLYDQPIKSWSGPPQTVLCDEFAWRRGNYGYRFETSPLHPGILGLALPWYGARDHRTRMQRASYVSSFIILTRDRDGGRVRIDREGRAVIDYRVGGMERELLQEGIANAARIHWAAGAQEIQTLHTRDHRWQRGGNKRVADIEAYCAALAALPVHGNRCGVFSAHQMGTARMGVDRKTSVCDERGQVHGVRGLYVADASLFPASSGVNPMITVMALAYLVGEAVNQA